MSGKRKRADDLPENPLEGLPLTGPLSQQVTDTTVPNQQPAKEGAPIKRKKPTQLGILIEAGMIKDGAVLRYMKGTGLSYSGKLMAVGRARTEGVEVHGNSSLLGMSGFEAYARSTAHRPAQFTFTSTGLSLQQMQQQLTGQGGSSARKPPGKWGMTAEGKATHYPEPRTVTDLNDEVCRVCWQGGDLLCCETCPAVMHARCAGLPQAILLEPRTGSDAPVWRGPLSGDNNEAVLTMDAYAFDSLWPREGALAARMQLQAQAQAQREAAAAAAARQQNEAAQQRARPPSARLAQRPPAPQAEEDAELVEEPIKKEPAFLEQAAQPPTAAEPPLANFFPVDVHSSAQGEGLPEVKPLSTAAPANGEQKQDPGQAPADATLEPEPQQAVAAAAPMGAEASPRHTPRSPQTAKPADTFPAAPPSADSAWLGKLRRASQRAHSKQEIVSILDDMFPPTNSAAKTKFLKDAFAAVYPGHPYKSRVNAIRDIAESLWDAISSAKAGKGMPPAQSERQRRRGAGALMSAALAAEVSDDPELDGTMPGNYGAAASFLQVDGADDASSADEGHPQPLPASAAHSEAISQPPAAQMQPEPSGSGGMLQQAPSSHPAPGTASQAAVPAAQQLSAGPVTVPFALAQTSVPPFMYAGQLPPAQEMPTQPFNGTGALPAVPAAGQPAGQRVVLDAEALTAALQEEVRSLSRRLGPAEAMRQALQSQMWALHQNNAALKQPGAAPTALPAHAVAPNMPVMIPVVAAQAVPQAPSRAPARAKPRAAPKRPNQAQHQQPAVVAAASGHAVQQAPPVGEAIDLSGLDGSVAAVASAASADARRPLSAGFDSADDALAAFGRPTAPIGQPPSGEHAALVSCAGCGARWHLGCLPQDAWDKVQQGIWFHSEACRATDARMAELAVSGLMPVQAADDATSALRFAWQLIRGAAVSSPKDCCGHAPAYGDGARETLRETMYALRHLFHEALGPLHDSRTGQDLLPLLLQGKTLRRHLLDFSGFHTAVLWLGPSIVAAGCIRVLGAEVAELPALVVRPELEGNGLGRLLLALLESAVMEAGVKLLAMPALVPFPSFSPKQADMAAGQPGESGAVAHEPIPTWAKAMGYRQATCSQLACMSTLPVLHFWGAQFAVKELSTSTCLEVKVPGELRLSKDMDEQEYCRARLLQPAGLPAYTAQRARADAQAAEPEQAAVEDVPGGGASEEPRQAAVKSEQQESAGLMERARSTVGGLGRVKVPKGGFKQ